jgi:hypothetical protein
MRYTAELLPVLHARVTTAHHRGNSTMVSTRSHWFSWIRYTSLCARSGSPNPSAPCENSADCCGHCGQLASSSYIFRQFSSLSKQLRSTTPPAQGRQQQEGVKIHTNKGINACACEGIRNKCVRLRAKISVPRAVLPRAGETCVPGALAVPFHAEQAALLHSVRQMGTLETGWVRKASLRLPRLSSLPSPRMEPGRTSQRGRRPRRPMRLRSPLQCGQCRQMRFVSASR